MPLIVRELNASDDLARLTRLIHIAYKAHADFGLNYWGTHQTVEDTAFRLSTGIGFLLLNDDEYLGTILVRAPQPTSPVMLYRNPGVFTFSQFCVSPTLAGCGQLSPPGNAKTEAEKPEREKEHLQAYLTCRATFTTLEQDHPWSDESSLGHDDGKAPLASFVFVEPATHANRAIGILFKYAASVDAASPPVPADIGSQFTFQIPADFLPGNHKTIDNTNVRHFRKVEP